MGIEFGETGGDVAWRGTEAGGIQRDLSGPHAKNCGGFRQIRDLYPYRHAPGYVRFFSPSPNLF